jgi:hypothetical protein
MAIDPTPSPSRAELETRADDKKPSAGATTPRNNIFFELPRSDCPKAQNTGKTANPFASPVDGKNGWDERYRCQEEMPEGWSFQGRRKHAPKIASPRLDPKQAPTQTPQQEPTSGGKRQQFHSEVHTTYFSSLGIAAPSTGEPFRVRIWPVLTREKNEIKETLVYSKNQARPSLPLSLRITGPIEAEWTQDSAWADLTQRLETELEEKVLRYKLTIKTRPMLEWSWMKESSRGGTECTILAHIDSGTSALSIQNKRHLHWKALDDKIGMGNEMEFSAPAHSLLMKTEAVQSEHQEIKNRSVGFQASPQAARKKRYTKLNYAILASSEANEEFNPGRVGEEGDPLGSLETADDRETGSFGSKAARNRLNYA